jgi:hypothetical protein
MQYSVYQFDLRDHVRLLLVDVGYGGARTSPRSGSTARSPDCTGLADVPDYGSRQRFEVPLRENGPVAVVHRCGAQCGTGAVWYSRWQRRSAGCEDGGVIIDAAAIGRRVTGR